MLRAGMGAHQERVVNQDAQAADRKKVPAEVIQVASHEVDTDSDKDESIVATSGVKVRVNRSRMTLPPRWPLMLNSMRACKPSMLQWVVTFKTKRPLSGLSSLSLCKNVWTILTVS